MINSDSTSMEKSLNLQIILRMTFSLSFVAMLLGVMFSIADNEKITQEECMRDYTFILTDSINQYLEDHPFVTDIYIIYCSFLMDTMFIVFLYFFYLHWRTFRLVISYTLFFGVRSIVQELFLMNRLDGFLFAYPGIPSLTVPYWDTNDFFYSGHVGTCLLIALEYRSYKWNKMYYLTLIIMMNQWIMMCLVRAHYIIDLITGVVVAHYSFMHAEWLAYYLDVKILGLPGGKDRARSFYKPCKYCGWSNSCPNDVQCKEEKEIIKNLKVGQVYIEKQIIEEESKSQQSDHKYQQESFKEFQKDATQRLLDEINDDSNQNL